MMINKTIREYMDAMALWRILMPNQVKDVQDT